MNLTSEMLLPPEGIPIERSKDCQTLNIELLQAVTCNDCLASNPTIGTFALQHAECSGLQGATMEVTTVVDPGRIETINASRG